MVKQRPETSGNKLDTEVAPADWDSAETAPSAERKKRQKRDVIPECQCVVAVRARGWRVGEVFAERQAVDEHVEKRAYDSAIAEDNGVPKPLWKWPLSNTHVFIVQSPAGAGI